MKNEIIAISLKSDCIESIYAVTLAQGDYLTIDTLATYIQLGDSYFYFDSMNKEKMIEVVELIYKDPYIRTKSFVGKYDPILFLSTF